jgi:flavin-binding protein dodecin
MIASRPVFVRDTRLIGLASREVFMSVVKVVELLAQSEESWEDAARQVVAEATRTLRGVTSVYVKEFQATVENDRVKNFRVDAKVSFVMERK